MSAGTSLAVQWLRLHDPDAGGTGSVPGGRTKILHAMRYGQEKKNFFLSKYQQRAASPGPQPRRNHCLCKPPAPWPPCSRPRPPAEKPDRSFLHCVSALWWVTKRPESPLPSAPSPGSAHLSLSITAKPKTPTWSRSLLGWGNPRWAPAHFTALSRVPFACYWLSENVIQLGGVRHALSLLFSLFITHSAPTSSIKALAPRWEGQRAQSECLPCGWSSSFRHWWVSQVASISLSSPVPAPLLRSFCSKAGGVPAHPWSKLD